MQDTGSHTLKWNFKPTYCRIINNSYSYFKQRFFSFFILSTNSHLNTGFKISERCQWRLCERVLRLDTQSPGACQWFLLVHLFNLLILSFMFLLRCWCHRPLLLKVKCASARQPNGDWFCWNVTPCFAAGQHNRSAMWKQHHLRSSPSKWMFGSLRVLVHRSRWCLPFFHPAHRSDKLSFGV